MSLDRRDLFGAGAAVLGASLLPACSSLPQKKSGEGKKLLVLGGTRFLGPAIVDHALAEGYEVTLFNRGKSDPERYAELEQLKGDRDTGDLEALKGRSWDLVVDTSGYVPAHARQAAEVLRDAVEYYVFISTCSVYADDAGKNVTEESPVATYDEAAAAGIKTIRDVFRDMQAYGPLKALCEQAIEDVMPGRMTSLRPGVIAGPDDPGDRYLYWAIRIEQGGEMLCPGDPASEVQFIDVKDLGRMSVEFGADRMAGIYNSIGYAKPMSFEWWLTEMRRVLGGDARFTWASDEFLLEHQVTPFQELPMWLPPQFHQRFDNAKGIAAGMTFRPIADTTRDIVAWHHATRDETYEWGVYGMKPAREQELLAAWKAREA